MLIEAAIVAVAIIVLLIVLSKLNIRRQRKNALQGKYGDETRWATELIEEGDEHFTLAVSTMPDMELKEVGIIAESKEELRERTVERFEENFA